MSSERKAWPVSGCRMQRPVGSGMFSPEAWQRIAHSLKLSGRELQIVQATFDDRTERAMAADLQMAPSTIHTQVHRLHHKLTVTARAQLLLRITSEFLALTATAGNNLPPICADAERLAARTILSAYPIAS